MKRLVSSLHMVVALLLFVFGVLLALNAKRLGLNSWNDIAQSTRAALLGAPADRRIEFAFDELAFGEASLFSSSTADIPLPSRIDPDIERLADFAPGSVYRELATGVMRLDLLVDAPGANGAEKRVSPCTAILVADDLIMTARHCVEPAFRGANEIDKASLRFGYLDDASPQEQGVGVETELSLVRCAGAERLDVAVLKLAEASGRAIRDKGFAPVRIAGTAIKLGQDLFVVHHPLGDAMHISRRQCRAGADALGDGGAASAFSHTCGTLPGTSGAPIFDDRTRTVIGVHVRGEPNVIKLDQKSGDGVPISAIAQACPPIQQILQRSSVVASESL